jgi:hypothetical protein
MFDGLIKCKLTVIFALYFYSVIFLRILHRYPLQLMSDLQASLFLISADVRQVYMSYSAVVRQVDISYSAGVRQVDLSLFSVA